MAADPGEFFGEFCSDVLYHKKLPFAPQVCNNCCTVSAIKGAGIPIGDVALNWLPAA